MDQQGLRDWAGPIVAFLASTVVVPAGLAALGLSWRLIFAVSLCATTCVAWWGFPQWRTLLGIAVILTAIYAVWELKNERGYKITYQLCRSEVLVQSGGDPRLERYQLGARLFNESGYDLWARVDEERWTFGNQAAAESGVGHKPFRVINGTRQLVVSNGIDLAPPIPLDQIPKGHIRYVIRYGKTEDAQPKTLTISGDYSLFFRPDGQTGINFELDRDSQGPITWDLCRLPD
jgi:hypothetical protein